ncbi:MAG TPA: metallopeptidase TldD-related protein [Cyclobacteriaceae bacterium]|nr:metallopeptidase TldD-related protein [Cyclobacteriaceae bacterium]
MIKPLLILALALCCTVTYAQTARNDKFLDILERELNREVTEFQKVSQIPYFIDYRVNDEESAVISASFGSLTQSYSVRDRALNVHVRVGDYTIDNTHPAEPGVDDFMPGFSMSETSLPLDDNEDAISVALWRATQAEYRSSLEQFKSVKNALAVKKKAEKVPADFSKENAEKYYEAPGPTLSGLFKKEEWEKKVRQYSGLFLGDASIVNADVTISFSVERRYYVSSEGASVVQNSTSIYLYVIAGVRATDGDIVPLHQSYYAPTTAELPGDATIENDIKTMIVTLQKLKTAPLADAYTGPAMLDGSVAGVFFHEIFGHRVEGHRLKSITDGQTFKSKVDEKILPESISVYCDPTVNKFANTFLNGIYQYDDEGVKAQRVNIVEKGILKNFLMSRSPLENFTRSNGHGRATAGISPVSRQSNLFVEAAKTKTTAELRQMLIKECQRQKKKYGYFFKSVVGGFTFTDRYTPNAFNIFPTEVYRVYVDGRPDELVRGVDLIGTPLAMFAEIAAVGDTHQVFTGFCGAESGYVPVSAISPALFVRRIETQKKAQTKVEETVLTAPLLQQNK